VGRCAQVEHTKKESQEEKMKLIMYILPVAAFFIGVFCGYNMRKKEWKHRNKLVWDRIERRNIMRTINALVSAIDFKDHLTRSHSDNVQHYACAIAREMGLSKTEVERIKEACQVHDLGKIGVHDDILTKQDVLTEQEYKEIKLHSLAGAVILKPFRFLEKIVQLVRQHHERYDGKGYPDGIKGEEISIGARIMAIADSFDAMTNERPYRRAMTKEQAVAELKRNSGTQFDPRIVEVFLNVLEKHPDIFKQSEGSSHDAEA